MCFLLSIYKPKFRKYFIYVLNKNTIQRKHFQTKPPEFTGRCGIPMSILNVRQGNISNKKISFGCGNACIVSLSADHSL